ncbi:hypothetical protein KJ708_01995 [bacterium]|nr:hypothetical protein [bacterium]
MFAALNMPHLPVCAGIMSSWQTLPPATALSQRFESSYTTCAMSSVNPTGLELSGGLVINPRGVAARSLDEVGEGMESVVSQAVVQEASEDGCEEPLYIGSVIIPGRVKQMIHYAVTEGEKPQILAALQEMLNEFAQENIDLMPLIESFRADSKDLSDFPEINRLNFTQLYLNDLITFAAYTVALMRANLEKQLFVGLSFSVDTLRMEIGIRFKQMRDQTRAGHVKINPNTLKKLERLELSLAATFADITKRDYSLEEPLFSSKHINDDGAILSLPFRYNPQERLITELEINPYERGSLYLHGHAIDHVRAVEEMMVALPTGEEVFVRRFVFGANRETPNGLRWSVGFVYIAPDAMRLLGSEKGIMKDLIDGDYYNLESHKMGIVTITGSHATISFALPKNVWSKEASWKRQASKIAAQVNARLTFPIDAHRINAFKKEDGYYVSYTPVDEGDVFDTSAIDVMNAYDAVILLVLYWLNIGVKGDILSNIDFRETVNILKIKLEEEYSDAVKAKIKERIDLYTEMASVMDDVNRFTPFDIQDINKESNS